jgi:hypothetical protein
LLYLLEVGGATQQEVNFMARTAEELLAEALDLSEDSRAQLARSLIASLDLDLDDAEEGADPADVESAWLAEVSRRAATIDVGTASTRPAAEVFRAAREELRTIRTRRMSRA